MPNLLIVDPQDTPNIGRYKINYNFSILAFSSFTGIAASIFTNPNPTTVTVGGIPAGSTFPTDQYLQNMMDLLLYPAVTPNFTSFLISAQATTLEVGATVSGSKTFTWAIANTADLLANSIDIEDTTNSTSLATGLADDGTETVFLTSVTKTVPDYNVWTISAQDTDTTVFSRTYTIEWRYAAFYGISASLTLNAASIVALAGTSLVTDVNGSYSLVGSGYGYLCVPTTFSAPNGFRDSSTNLPIEMAGTSEGYTSFDGTFFYDSVSVTRNGVPITYRVYRTKYSITTSTMNVAVTGGTVSTLQSVINAGNTATGNASILGNFSATTYYSGNTPLSTIISNYLAGAVTYVQPGTNITTGGTPLAPVISVVASPSFTSVSASTFFSAGTDLSTILSGFGTGSNTYVQPGINITTGGTATRPIINVVGSPAFTAVTAQSLSANTIYSGVTPLQNVFTLNTVVNAGNTAERSIFLQGNGSGGALVRKLIFKDTDVTYSGISDPSIGIDYTVISAGAQLYLESPDTIYHITKSNVQPSTSYPGVIPNFFIGEDTGTAPSIWMGFLSVTDSVDRAYNYIRIGETDLTNNYQGEVLLTATGTSSVSGQYIANFPAKSGTVAMLSDVTSGNTTYVQPGTNISTGGTPNLPIINVVDDPVFNSVFATSITATTFFSGSTPLASLLTGATTPSLSQVVAVGNTANDSIVIQGDGSGFDLQRKVTFKDTDATFSGSSDPWIGLDYTISPGYLYISTPFPLYSVSYAVVSDISFFPISLTPHYTFSSGLGFAPPINFGYLSAATTSDIAWNYITIGERDATNNYNSTIYLTATGTTSALQTYYKANFQAKDGTVAYLDDISVSAPTYVQPGTNITTGGTASNPIISVVGSPTFSAITSDSVFSTNISGYTFYSGTTPFNTILSNLPVPSLQAVTSAGNTTSNDVYFTSDGEALAIRGIYFQELSLGLSGSSNPFIGSDYNFTFTPNLTFKSPSQFWFVDESTMQSLAPGIMGGLIFYNTGTTGAMSFGNATVGTEIDQYITFQSYDTSTGFFDHITITATGVTNNGGFSQNHMLFLPVKSGIIATLDDIATGVTDTYVQPGINITTGGTASRPVINVSGTPVFTSVTAVSMTAVTMSANSLVLESYSSNTASYSASGIRLYDRSKAGRNMLETKDAAGTVTNFQPHMGMTNVRFVKALGNGGTTMHGFGLSPIIGGTSQPKTFSTSSLLGSLQRVGMRTTAVASTSSTLIFNNGGLAPFWLGNTTNAGGFHAIFRFGIAQVQTNMRWFVGMHSATTAISNVEPQNLGNILGFGINSGETTVRFMHNDGSGVATTIDLGSNFPATTANVVYEAHLYVAPNTTTIYYYLERLDSTQQTEGSVSTNIPPSTVFLTPHFYINNSSTAADAIMDFIQIQVETKY